MKTSPPSPVSPVPTRSRMSPPDPSLATPVPKVIWPELPVLVVPVLIEICPLTPLAPAFGVCRKKGPLDVEELYPVLIEM
eukprot:scaffold1748_cov258-Pinguiococcus_pyrenoidosus.AAC.21